MKQGKISFLKETVLIFFIFFIISCAPSYIPNVVNTPLFSNRGEFQASVNNGVSGFNPQLAYAISDRIGIMLNGSFANRTSDTTKNFHKHQFIEFGFGYYHKIANNGRFEIYSGTGFGKVNSFYDNELWYDKTDISSFRVFLQPTIGATTNIFDGSFAPRIVMINFSQGTTANSGFFIEPTISAKLGYKYIKILFQLGFSLPLNSRNINFEYQPFIFSIGLLATLGKKYKV